MPGEAEVFTRVSKATATDIEPARFRHDAGDDEYEHPSSEDKNTSTKKNARDEGETGKNFEPGQIEGEPDAELPRQHLIVVDVARERDRLDDFDDAGVDEQRANQDSDEPQNDRLHFFFSQASQPPFRIRISLGNFASSRRRRATSSARLQLAALQ